MHSPCLKEVEQVCSYGCCSNPLLSLSEFSHTNTTTTTTKPPSTTSVCRKNFTTTTTTSFFPNTYFTNHESLPSLKEAITTFTQTYPKYSDTNQVDRIRGQEYYHLSLSNRICLDYIGIGLFSHLQLQTHQNPVSPSSSDLHNDFPFFSTIYKSVNLRSHLLHGGEGSEFESSIRKRIMEFMNVSSDEYCMVFTCNKSSAFKIVSEGYPFATSSKLLTVYDYKSEAVDTMVSASEKRGAKIMSAEFKWPRMRIHSAKLRKMVERKRKKKKTRGLFVFPLQSKTTGASYSYQWMSKAQENGWHVLLDACALGPKDTFSPNLWSNDWKGEKVEPALVQKLSDRNNISLSHGFLHQIWFADKYAEEKERVMAGGSVKKSKGVQEIAVVTAAITFLANFEDVYRLWAFVARFLDADYVEKERWRYTALNQKTIEV